ncbi:phosphoglycerate mutase-like protein [Aureobasidium pullulans]|nr:phosphoglycerate mutase-like protein [Aureobasidium pullulans]
MPDKDAGTPRLFLIRHGETEWSMSGKHTGKTDIPLTAHGESQVRSTGAIAVGDNKLIDPSKLGMCWVSPRTRAQHTFSLLFGDKQEAALREQGKVQTTEQLGEWDYGAYEGLKPAEIRDLRKSKGLDTERKWDIWRDGCEDGESPDQVAARIDELIVKIRELQGPNMNGEQPCDVVLVAHGHLTRCFAKRWLGYPLDMNLNLMMEPGGVGVLSYSHHKVDEPALLLGIGFPAES